MNPKVSDEVLDAARIGAPIRVFILLKNQPQDEIVTRIEGIHRLRREVAEGRYKAAVERVAFVGVDLAEAHRDIDEQVMAVRKQAFHEIEQEVRSDLDGVQAKLESLGGTSIVRFLVVPTLSVTIPPAAAAILADDSRVERIELVHEHEAQIYRSVPSTGAPSSFWANSMQGDGQSVAVLDSGVGGFHPAFGGRVTFLTPAVSTTCAGGDNPAYPGDYVGHGTHVAGIIGGQGIHLFTNYNGMAPKVAIINMKVGCRQANGRATFREDDVILGLEKTLQQTATRVLNLSLGRARDLEDDNFARIVDKIADTWGALMVIAAGNVDDLNSNSEYLASPAIGYNGIAVANAKESYFGSGVFNQIHASSSIGPTFSLHRKKPDIAAPGSDIYSTDLAYGGGASIPPFAPRTGTSMAAPHVAGSAALLRQRGVTDAKAIKAILLNSANYSALGDWDPAAGWGYMNLSRAYAQSTQQHFKLATLSSAATANSYRLYKGSTLGYTSATVVWNRYFNGSIPVLTDLDLSVFSQQEGTLLDSSTSRVDNVEQIYLPTGRDVVIKVRSVTQPRSSEPFAIAFSSANFVEAAGPQLNVSCTGPASTSVETQFTVSCSVSNVGDLPAFGVTASLNFEGHTGGTEQNYATLAPGASSSRTWNVSVINPGNYRLVATASCVSFGETLFSTGGVSFVATAAVGVGGGGGAVTPGGLRFVSVSPCRLMETRAEYNFEGRTGAFGPPHLRTGETRTLTLANSNVCQIPTTARAYVLNVTLIPRGAVDFATLWPGGEIRPNFWSIRSPDGQIVANQAIVKSGNGAIQVYVSNDADLLIDISGYFADPLTTGTNLVFYPLTPCRVIETRVDYRSPPGPFGPPTMAKGETRRFRFPSTPYCSVPSGATAYSATLTVVAPQPLPFMTLWPAGGSQPNVSSINSFAGRTLANNVIIPASADGSADVFAFDRTDFIVDINGYFAPDNGQGLYYFPVIQCRASDSTVTGGAYPDNTTRTINVPAAGNCAGIPTNSRGYVVNVTAIPGGAPMPFITVYPTGQSRPNASVLNAFEGQIVTNSTIVPAGTNGAIDVYAFRRTHAVVDISGFFGR